MCIKREFGGVSTYKESVNVEEHFEEWYNDAGNLFLLGKKEFQHEEEGFNFKYRYAIRALDIEELSGEEGAPIHIELLLVPSPESLCEKAIEDVGGSFDWDSDDLSIECKYWDIAEYSYAVRMLEDSIEGLTEDKYDLLDLEPVKAKIEALVATYEAVDSMRGFNLDRAWNMIGTTGWDTLKCAILGEQLFKF